MSAEDGFNIRSAETGRGGRRDRHSAELLNLLDGVVAATAATTLAIRTGFGPTIDEEPSHMGCEWTWCASEFEWSDDGVPVTVHSGNRVHFGDKPNGAEVHLTALSDEQTQLVHIGDYSFTLEQAMALGEHLVGLATVAAAVDR